MERIGGDILIDLHIHTTCSDGIKDPVQILKEASDLGLSKISITDHNTVAAYRLIHGINTFKGNIIKGCELTCMLDDVCIELLAYRYDIDTLEKIIKEIYLPFPEQNVKETNLVIEKLLKTDLVFNPDDILYDKENEYGNRGVHRELIKHPENRKLIDPLAWEDPHVFSVEYLSKPNSPYYIDYSSLIPSYQDVIKAIKESDGLIFMPHIFKYEDNLDMVLSKLFKKHLLDGIECYHSSFTNEDTINALKLAKEYALHISGGTDTHGYDDEVRLGVGYGDMSIPDDITNSWCLK